MQNFDFMLTDDFQRKVFLVVGNDRVSVADDGGGQDMPVIRVWQLKTTDKVLIVLYQRIFNRGVHKFRRHCQFDRVKFRAIL